MDVTLRMVAHVYRHEPQLIWLYEIIVKRMQDMHNMLGIQIYYGTYHHS